MTDMKNSVSATDEQKNQTGKKENNQFSEQEKHGEQGQHQKPQNDQQQRGGGTQSVPQRRPGSETENETEDNEKIRKSA